MAALMRSVASRERSLIKLDAEQQAAGGYGGPPLTVHDRAFKLGGALRSPDCPAGGVRIDGSGTRASSLLDRVERDATPCLLITLVCGAFCRRPTTLLGTWRPRRTARGSLLANVWCRSFSCGSGRSAVSESSSGWEFAVQFRLGIDIACRAAHQVSLADEQGRFIWTGRRFRTTPQDLDRLWNMLPDGTDPAQVLVVMEPTRNAWVPLRLVPTLRRRRGPSATGAVGRSAPLLRQAHQIRPVGLPAAGPVADAAS